MLSLGIRGCEVVRAASHYAPGFADFARSRGFGFAVPHFRCCSSEVSDWVTLWQPAHGGHVGFPPALLSRHGPALPEAVGGWLPAQLHSP